MTLSSSSPFVRWTYFFNHRHLPPARTSLCALFWRGCVLMPLAVATMAIGAGVVLYLVGDAIWLALSQHLRSTLLWVAGIALLATAVFWSVRLERARPILWIDRVDSAFDRVERSIVWRGAAAVHAKVCPIVEIVEPAEDRR
jgi:hypothetical protein